ncbi:MAG: response regulator with CheY-like receiver domain and winged-helix DNA-binding domain [Mycobacterium sp.]|nr:response regulator with CheY-like receiver domain and winged-helix DNA-binding domain [Mycobacterium sp.]MDT5179579.1 two-component system, OmpR family, response regulator [Mycobacterium sp.]
MTVTVPSRLDAFAGMPAAVVRADGSPIKVLVVDDEPVLAELLTIVLRREGWQVSTAGDGSSAVRSVQREAPDVVVLDLALPDADGLAVMRTLRDSLPNLPVMLLSAKASVEDRIAGLAQGGDDYVTKPFNLEEVVLRLRGLIKRSGVVTDMDRGQIVVGDLVLDIYSHDVTRSGKRIDLTATEFKLLRYLMTNPGRVVAKSQILEEVWKCELGGSPNLVEIFISYLRKKIDSGHHRPMIHTVRGCGYVLRAR